MANIFRRLAQEQGIFRDEKYLQPDYMPAELYGRDSQMKDMASFLQAAAKGSVPPSMLLVGKPGTGKTSMAKLILNQLCEVSSKPKKIYINCWENTTRYGILNKLVMELGDMLPRRGIATDEIVERLSEIGRREKTIPIIILDEVDRLLSSGESQVLYDLSRAQEALGLSASVIAITNEEDLPAKLDARVRSSLTNHTIHFPAYTPNELKEILLQRSKGAFFADAIDSDVVGLCSAIGAKNGGDARLTIHLLWAAGKMAQSEGAKKITVGHVQKVKQRSEAHARIPAQRKTDGLDEIDKQIIEFIKSNPACDSGSLYSHLGAKDENLQRNARNHLQKLEAAGLIVGAEASKGAGRSRKWNLKKEE